MTIYRRTSLGLVASAVFVSGLIFAASVTRADPVSNEVMLVNGQTGKCLTIAGGSSTDNNVPSVQFDCDSDPSRRWRLNERADGIYQLRNVQTNKCLTIAGGSEHRRQRAYSPVRLRQPSVADLEDQRRDRQRPAPDQERAD